MDIMNTETVEILLVEDNPGDIELTREAFEGADLKSKLNITNDGDEALDYLFKRGDYKNVSTPDIILLDLNLPSTDGFDVLREMKKSNELKDIPTIVLSSSRADHDINNSYSLNANCYIAKPDSPMKYIKVVRIVENFWSETCCLPVR